MIFKVIFEIFHVDKLSNDQIWFACHCINTLLDFVGWKMSYMDSSVW